jgi:hypothetical protein
MIARDMVGEPARRGACRLTSAWQARFRPCLQGSIATG